MSLHVFANIVTPFGTAANNRAENEGNITTLQKLLWLGETHSTVSAEAIRFALRRRLAAAESQGTNRTWNEDLRRNEWRGGREVDTEFAKWSDAGYIGFIDDDLLGFMAAEAAKDEAEDTDADGTEADSKKEKPGKGKKSKGTATTRRSPLEITRAVSLTPWVGDVTFNAASPMATPSAAKKGTDNPVPYGTELHATRYQYGIALTPERLRDKSRAAKAVDALCNLGTVAGNHGRFLFDFSPDAIVIRVTQDPAPRLLYCFDTPDAGKSISATKLADRIEAGDIDPAEIVVAGLDLVTSGGTKLASHTVKARDETKTKSEEEVEKLPGHTLAMGIKEACAEAVRRINAELKVKA